MRRDRPKIDPYDDDMWARLARQAASSLPTFLDIAPPTPTPPQPPKPVVAPKPANPTSERTPVEARPPVPAKQLTEVRTKPGAEGKPTPVSPKAKTKAGVDVPAKQAGEVPAKAPAARVKPQQASPAPPPELHTPPLIEAPIKPPASQPALTEPAAATDVQPQPVTEAGQPARPRQKTTRYKGISRIDHKRTHGYFARVSWEGRVHSKLFSDKKHGDRLAALAAALEWRDEMEKQLGKPRTEEMVFGKAVAGSSKIGIHKRVKDGRLVYEATWREGQKVKRTSYSIRKHGEKKARALAIAARERAQARKLAARYGEAA